MVHLFNVIRNPFRIKRKEPLPPVDNSVDASYLGSSSIGAPFIRFPSFGPNMPLPDLFPLRPCYREAIWGGRGLDKHLNKALPPGKSIGESWELSAREGAASVVSEGPFGGWDLGRLTAEHGRELLGEAVYDRYRGEFPLLVKFLDACDDLSIQVHPDDRYARDEGLGRFGKMEAWYVLRSDGGRIVYGLEAHVSRQAFQEAVDAHRVEEVVRTFDVSAGDVVFMPPGTVHALGAGVIVYEVQQSSDLTFRIYDYDRPGPDGSSRELHVDRALDVITFGSPAHPPLHWCDLPGATSNHTLLMESEHFRLERCNPPERKIEHPAYSSLAAVTFLEGNAEITSARESYRARKGDTLSYPRRPPLLGSPSGRPPPRIPHLLDSLNNRSTGKKRSPGEANLQGFPVRVTVANGGSGIPVLTVSSRTCISSGSTPPRQNSPLR